MLRFEGVGVLRGDGLSGTDARRFVGFDAMGWWFEVMRRRWRISGWSRGYKQAYVRMQGVCEVRVRYVCEARATASAGSGEASIPDRACGSARDGNPRYNVRGVDKQ